MPSNVIAFPSQDRLDSPYFTLHHLERWQLHIPFDDHRLDGRA
jgi:hypothetical protein